MQIRRIGGLFVLSFLLAALPADLVGQGVPAGQASGSATTPRIPAATGRIRGRVLAAPGNTPLRRAQMTLRWSEDEGFQRITQTDAQGRFEFTELPAGRFTLTAGAAGFVPLQYGQRRPYESGTPITLRAAETAASIDFALPRGSVIAGRVSDEFGQPLIGAEVTARRSRYTESGQQTLAPVRTATTDDRGEFRLFGLLPGEYLVDGMLRSAASYPGSSTNPNNPLEGFQQTFYPGTANAADAHPISLGIGVETHIQIGLMPTRLVRVSGTIRDSQDRPLFPAQVTLWSKRGGMFSVGAGGSTSATSTADGSFTFAGVAAGEYALQVSNRIPGQLPPLPVAESGSLALNVRDADVSGLRITTSRGSVVSGRVIWEGAAPRMTLRASGQSVESVGPGTIMLSGNIDDSGEFQIGGLYGRVQLGVPLAANSNWVVKSVTVDGQDVTDEPVDVSARAGIEGVRIVMTDKVSNVSGQVKDGNGTPLDQYVVVLQAADLKEPRIAARWVRTARPDTDGRFEIRNLRPGRYHATAIDALEDGRQFSPEFQKELRRGAREFTVREGETMSLDLRLAP